MDGPETENLVNRATSRLSHSHAPPAELAELGVEHSQRLQALSQRFLDEIVYPISGELPASIKIDYRYQPITVGPTEMQIPMMRMAHQVEYEGKPYELRYIIGFWDRKQILASGARELEEASGVIVPSGEWSDSMREELRDKWRQLVIANPVLNTRFTSSSVVDTDFQVEAVKAAQHDLDESNKALLAIGTGLGKTNIYYRLVDAEMERRRQESSYSQERPVTLVIVNNIGILEGAKERLQSLYPDKYTTSNIHSDESDFTGDIIFASPSSLIQGDKLARLLGSRKIAMVVNDETHHLPAEQLARLNYEIEKASLEQGWQTKFVGVTATDIRTDRQSVNAFYASKISYSMSASKGFERGFLTSYRYLAGDLDLRGDDPAIVEDLEAHNKVSNKIANDSRFPVLLSQSKEDTKNLPYVTGIRFLPNIERAQAYTKYLNDNGENAVCLTSETRRSNPVWHEHCQHAWNTGAWPEGSPFEKLPRPENMVVVDLFNEGVDFRSVNYIQIIADTNSAVEFTQRIGRGMRPSPMKTQLVIRDSAGCFRKAHLLYYLGSLGRNKKQEESIQFSWGRAGSDDVEEQLPHHDERDQEDLAPIVDEFFNDVPTILMFRYGTYPSIPAAEYEALDNCLADRLNTPRDIFPVLLKNMAQFLVNATTIDSIMHVRQALCNCFSSPGFYERDDPGQPVPLTGPTTIIYQRLLARMQAAEPRLTEDRFQEAFPEFTQEKYQQRLNRSANLIAIRKEVFGLNRAQMVKELRRACVATLPDKSRELAVLLEDNLFVDRDPTHFTDLAYCEGNIPPADHRRTKEEERGSRSASEEMISNYQAPYINVYLHHPDIKGKLTSEDFNLTPELFKQRLAGFSVLKTAITSDSRFIKSVTSLLESIEYQVGAAPTELVASEIDRLRGALARVTNGEFPLPEDIPERVAKGLLDVGDRVETLARREGVPEEAITECRDECVKLLDQLGLRRDFAVEGLGAGSVTIERAQSAHDWRIYLRSSNETPREVARSEAIELNRRPDHLRRPVLIFRDRVDNNGLAQVAERETDYGVRLLIGAVVSAVDWASESDGRQPFVVLPLDREGNKLFSSMMSEVLEATDWDVLGQVRMQGTPNVGFRYGLSNIQNSRLSFLTPEYLRLNRIMGADASSTIERRLAEAYITFNQVVKEMVPRTSAALAPLMSQAGPLGVRCGQFISQQLQALMDESTTQREKIINFGAVFFELERDGDVDERLSRAVLRLVGASPYDRNSAYANKLIRLLGNSTDVTAMGEGPEQVDMGRDVRVQELINSFVRNHIDGKTPPNQDIRMVRELNDSLAVQASPVAEPSSVVARSIDKLAKAGPPFFNPDGNLLLWTSYHKRTGHVAHIDPDCAVYDESRRDPDSEVGRIELDDLQVGLWPKSKGKTTPPYTCCRACSAGQDKQSLTSLEVQFNRALVKDDDPRIIRD